MSDPLKALERSITRWRIGGLLAPVVITLIAMYFMLQRLGH